MYRCYGRFEKLAFPIEWDTKKRKGKTLWIHQIHSEQRLATSRLIMIELVKYKEKADEYEKENRNIRIFAELGEQGPRTRVH